MQKLIASYLFQNRKCILPHVGTLEIFNEEAKYDGGEQTISAPVPGIRFNYHPGDTNDLENFIAAAKGISKEEAADRLNKFSDEIKNLRSGEEIILPGAGSFYKDNHGSLSFMAEALPSAMYPAVKAERVIHPDRPHDMIVGDKETTSAVMTEYFAEEEPKKRSNWWIAAIVLFLVSAAAVIYYMNSDGHNSLFGISHKNEVTAAGPAYIKLP